MKYDALKYYLSKKTSSKWVAHFSKIEAVLNFKLPQSAKQYPAWWANQETASQARSWQDVGWATTDLDLGGETITFIRGDRAEQSRPVKKTNVRIIESPAQLKWDAVESLSGALKMVWEPLGQVYLDKNGKLTFPTTPEKPGLYRFRIREKGKNEARYVGESLNLNQRFNQNYRHSSQSQQTSYRMNNELKKALANNAQVSVSIITEKAWLVAGGKKKQANLSDKSTRRMFEHFAQCFEGDCIIDTLNR